MKLPHTDGCNGHSAQVEIQDYKCHYWKEERAQIKNLSVHLILENQSNMN
jgi:hypothetical protein